MKGELRVMGREGDTKVMWDSDNDLEVETAKESFDKLVGKGYAAFKVKKNGDQGARVKEFDADAEMLILVPPMAGG